MDGAVFSLGGSIGEEPLVISFRLPAESVSTGCVTVGPGSFLLLAGAALGPAGQPQTPPCGPTPHRSQHGTCSFKASRRVFLSFAREDRVLYNEAQSPLQHLIG